MVDQNHSGKSLTVRPVVVVATLAAQSHTLGGILKRGLDGDRRGGDGEVPTRHASQEWKILFAAAPILERVDLNKC